MDQINGRYSTAYEEGNVIGFKFILPHGQILEIRSEFQPDENGDIPPDSHYKIYIGQRSLPYKIKTQLEAISIAFAMQWTAFQFNSKE